MKAYDKVIEIFYSIDEFSKEFQKIQDSHTIYDGKKHRNKPSRLSQGEIGTILT